MFEISLSRAPRINLGSEIGIVETGCLHGTDKGALPLGFCHSIRDFLELPEVAGYV